MFISVGIREPSRNIKLWVASKDAKVLEDDQIVRTCGLMGRGQGPITTNK